MLIGSSMQRVTGMGFALVAAPFLVLLLGPIDGVILVNLCSALTAAIILTRVVRDVDWRRAGVLALFALVGIVPGAMILQYVPAAWLEISIGLLIAAGLTVSVNLGRVHIRDRNSFRAIAGISSGFMNATAGVGGPAVSIYALATNWPHRSFAATMQPYFLFIGLTSLGAKFASGSAEVPALQSWVWLLVAAACIAGLILGEVLARIVKPHIARRLLIVVAYIGSAATIARGITQLVG
ncbi:sulfite exporter TauE/SafE family protein [Cryobacterium sp. TMT2-4]|uniref:sulfite exporter TauE/SafE family protein n=1 Tax=Cryobacterium sp. TMT2-4 TaxID=1259254 RepID=UPI0021041A3B|nr:sulfite exporter TauE/SafE family protein [Cryobacterium sp. TMT2-4]